MARHRPNNSRARRHAPTSRNGENCAGCLCWRLDSVGSAPPAASDGCAGCRHTARLTPEARRHALQRVLQSIVGASFFDKQSHLPFQHLIPVPLCSLHACFNLAHLDINFVRDLIGAANFDAALIRTRAVLAATGVDATMTQFVNGYAGRYAQEAILDLEQLLLPAWAPTLDVAAQRVAITGGAMFKELVGIRVGQARLRARLQAAAAAAAAAGRLVQPRSTVRPTPLPQARPASAGPPAPAASTSCGCPTCGRAPPSSSMRQTPLPSELASYHEMHKDEAREHFHALMRMHAAAATRLDSLL